MPATRLFLVDGTLEHFRCFHGAPRASDAEGIEIGAARGFLWTLTKLLRRPDLTHVAVALDRMAPPARSTGADALLRSQSALIADIVRALGVVLWPMTRLQADDALATGAALYGHDADQVVICTTDKDLLQCVRGEQIVLWDRGRDRLTDEAALLDRFGVAPRSMPDWHALVGDPSDGLRGVPGFGPKAAGTLLARYGHLEHIPADHEAWDVSIRGAPRMASMLRQRLDEALLARDLGILRDDVPLPQAFGALAWRGPHLDALVPITRRLDAGAVLQKLPGVEGPDR